MDGKIDKSAPRVAARNTRLAATLLGLVAGMVGLSFAAVPLYDLFCRATGYGGTTQRGVDAPGAVSDRLVTVRFNADTARGMPWRFRPSQRQMVLRVGETGLAFYQAENPTKTSVTGTSTFNVTPQKAGAYFVKIECFCFTEQVLAAGKSVEMPVEFFVDPAMLDDTNMDDVTTITLSYTFFRVGKDDAAGDALAARPKAGVAGVN